MSLEALARAFEAGECGLWEDGLAQCGEELAQQAPAAGSGQAACGRGDPRARRSAARAGE